MIAPPHKRRNTHWMVVLLTALAVTCFTFMAAAEVVPSVAEAQGKIDINSADLKTLTKLPGVGKVTAGRIIEYRTKNGAFKSVSELTKIKGIGKKTLEKISPMAVAGEGGGAAEPDPAGKATTTKSASKDGDIDLTGGPGPAKKADDPPKKASKPNAGAGGLININTASAKELTKLKGIGKSKAAAIVDYRNTSGPFKAKVDITKVKGIGKGTFAKIEDMITVE